MDRRTVSAIALALLLLAATRTESADKDPALTQDKQLDGTWERTSAIKDGEKLPAPKEGKFLLVVKGNTFTIKIGDMVVAKGTQTMDAGKTPKTLDIVPSDAPEKSKPILGIYEVKGDKMRGCIADPGKERPTEFSSKKDSGHLLATYKRIEP